jgi:molybdenum cofactor cytidylyltransferase
MGVFKPLLPFGARTVIEACIKNLREAGAGQTVVVLGHRAEELQERFGHLPISFALNTEADSEMGVSIARGVERVADETDAILIALVDQPAIPPQVISHLIAERVRTGAALLVPSYQGRGGHPVLVDLKYRAELLDLDPQRGLRAFFDKHKTEALRVPVASPYIARDMDTWDDYRSLHLEIFNREPPGSEPS